MAYPQWALPQVPHQEAALAHTAPYSYAFPPYVAGLDGGHGQHHMPQTMHPDILPPDDDDNCLYVNPKQ
jgi:hypothetical protein